MSPSPSADAVSPDSPTSPSPTPSPKAGPASLLTTSLFLPPTGPASPLPPPSQSSTTGSQSSLQGDDAAAPTWSGDYADDAATSGPSESSDTPLTGSGLSVSKAGLRAAIGRVVRTVTGVVNQVATSTQLEQEFDVWKADEEDVRDISDPAARVIWRRVPAEARTGDMVDLFVLGLAVIGYVAKSLDRRTTVRQMQATTDAALAMQAEPVGPAAATVAGPWPATAS